MNLWVYSLLIFVTVVGLLITPLLITYFIGRNRWELARTIRHLIWIYGRVWLLIITPFVDFKREGLTSEQVPENCVFVVNHLSFFDTYFIGALPNSDLTFAVRSWPFKMFWYRIFMRLAQYLEVEDLSWEETLRIGGEILNKGGAVVFFPEGHRSRSGQLQRFYSGAFKLAIASGRPIVPLCICGTDELLPPGRRYLKPATVRLHILPTVDNADYSEIGGHIRLRKEVKGQIARQLELMRADGYSADNGEQ
ncbi:MAG: 1-acyl-sn-glycerol-3-phosphate acyltransferase [Desulfobacteraceae bacterium 4572_35.1]|nr:MAG: 1-acyl-sn-glycerol-3-phosphate acyltransferase [Desulfobacteraceae bacterium 4572_35.1]